jgi:hypothetical protein
MVEACMLPLACSDMLLPAPNCRFWQCCTVSQQQLGPQQGTASQVRLNFFLTLVQPAWHGDLLVEAPFHGPIPHACMHAWSTQTHTQYFRPANAILGTQESAGAAQRMRELLGNPQNRVTWPLCTVMMHCIQLTVICTSTPPVQSR